MGNGNILEEIEKRIQSKSLQVQQLLGEIRQIEALLMQKKESVIGLDGAVAELRDLMKTLEISDGKS